MLFIRCRIQNITQSLLQLQEKLAFSNCLKVKMAKCCLCCFRNEESEENELDDDKRIHKILKTKSFGKFVYHVKRSNIPCEKLQALKQCYTIDGSKTVPQVIASYGYPVESHIITTDDGYILTLHRIPHSQTSQAVPEKTVLFHHGLLGSSADWILTGPEKALAYYFSDAGYDVWLANARGNTYSRAHTSLDVDCSEFWDFSWHDISQKDVPAVIDYIISLKGDGVKINYVGHSMGTTILFALLSTKPEYNKKLRAGFALAPVAYMSKIRTPLKYLAPFSNDLECVLHLLGRNELLPHNWFATWLSIHFSELCPGLAENFIFLLCGFDSKQFNKDLFPTLINCSPAGTSVKTVVHYGQEIAAKGRFQHFDYGKKRNLVEYGTKKPPAYNISNIKLPIALLSSRNDWLAGNKDVARLYKELPNKIEHYVVPMKEFNHLDFLIATDASRLVNNSLLKLMEKDLE